MTGSQLRSTLSSLRSTTVLRATSLAQLALAPDLVAGDVVDLPEGQFEIVAGGSQTANGTTVADLAASGTQAVLRPGQRVETAENDLLTDTRSSQVLPEGTRIETRDGHRYKVLPGADPDPDIETAGGVKLSMVPTWNNTQRPEDLGIDTSGSFTDSQRKAAFQTLIRRAAARKHEILVPKAAGHWRLDAPLNLLDGVRMNIDGVVENTAVTSAEQNLFQLGNQHPAYWKSDSSEITWFECAGVGMGETVTLDSGSNRTAGVAAIASGDMIMLRSKAYWLGAGDHERPLHAMLATVVDVDAGTGVITFDRGIPEAYGDSLIGLPNDDSVTGLTGEGLFATRGVRVFGDGKLVSVRHFISRGGFMDAIIDMAEIDAETVFYSNLMQDSQIRFGKVTVREKLLDCAANSLRSRFVADSVVVQGAGGTGALGVMNENSAYCTMQVGDILAPAWEASGGNFKFLNSRYCEIDVGTIVMPGCKASFCTFENEAYPVSGLEVQPLTVGNVFRLRGSAQLGSALGRFVYERNVGGEARHNRLTGGTYFGTPSSGYAVEIGGSNTLVEGVQCEHGALRTNSTTQDAQLRNSHFGDGLSVFTDPNAFAIQGITSDSQRLLRAAGRALGSSDTSSTTTANDAVLETVFPAGTLLKGDEILIELAGEITNGGAPGAKTLRIADDSGALISVPFLAAEDGSFHVEARISVQTTAIYSVRATGWMGTDCVARTAQRLTGLDLAGSSRTMRIERWVEDAGDEIRVDFARIRPSRPGHV